MKPSELKVEEVKAAAEELRDNPGADLPALSEKFGVEDDLEKWVALHMEELGLHDDACLICYDAFGALAETHGLGDQA